MIHNADVSAVFNCCGVNIRNKKEETQGSKPVVSAVCAQPDEVDRLQSLYTLAIEYSYA